MLDQHLTVHEAERAAETLRVRFGYRVVPSRLASQSIRAIARELAGRDTVRRSILRDLLERAIDDPLRSLPK